MDAATAFDEAHWRRVLSASEYDVLRLGHTEPAGSGEYYKAQPSSGHFVCRACSRPLYSTGAKFASDCGWPAFSRCYTGALRCKPDLEHFNCASARDRLACSPARAIGGE